MSKNYDSMSFSKAFASARKAGEKTFKWKGNYYSTKIKDEVQASKHVSYKNDGTAKASGERAKAGRKDGDLYGGRFSEITVTAPYKRIDKDTKGFVPTNRRDLVDKEGRPRVHFNTENRMYYVTDNYGNIQGVSMDRRAGNEGFNAFVSYTGNENDLRRSGTAQLADRAMVNEVNQLDEQRRIREQQGLIDDINSARTGFANVVSQAINVPNHAVMGAIRLASDDDYTMRDYKRGFDLNHSNENLNQTIGLGDVLDIKDERLRFAMNAVGNTYTLGNFKSTKSIGKISSETVWVKSNKANRSIVPRRNNSISPVKNDIVYVNEKIVPDIRFQPNTPIRRGAAGSFQPNTPVRVNNSGSVRQLPGRSGTPINTIEMEPITVVRTQYGRTFQPNEYHYPIVGDLTKRDVYTREQLPFMIEYNAVSNPTLEGRLMTGDFVPGTTAPTWGNSDNDVRVRMSGGEYATGLGGVSLVPIRETSVQPRVLRGDNISPVSFYKCGGKIKKKKRF